MTVGFLFDNDGVLIDSRELHFRAWEEFSRKNLERVIDYATFLEGFGKSNETFLRDHFPKSTVEQRAAWAEGKEEIFRTLAQGQLALLPGVEAFLQDVEAHQFSKIIASSAPRKNLEFFLEKTPLGKYFTTFVSGEEVRKGKPAPHIFREAARRIGRLPKECIVLEDAPAGLLAARRAGCFSVALLTTHPKEALHHYDLLIESTQRLHLPTLLTAYAKWKVLAWRRFWKKVAGWTLIVCGVISLFLPVVFGFVLILYGAYLVDNVWIQEKVRRWKARKEKRPS